MSLWQHAFGTQNNNHGAITDELTLRKHDRVFKLERSVKENNQGIVV